MQPYGTPSHIPGMYEGYVDVHEMLERKVSNIKNAGDGIFATKPIPAGTLLFTYTARLINCPLTLGQDRHYTFDIIIDPNDETVRGKETYCAAFYDLGGYINDIVDFRPLTQAESLELFKGKPPLTKYTYNCRYEHDVDTKKVRIVTIKDIVPGEELFVSYGVNYWVPRYIVSRLITGVSRVTAGVNVSSGQKV
jgi:hypothetical protein